MVERDAGSIAKCEDVGLTEGGGGASAVVVLVGVDVRGDLDAGPPGAAHLERGRVPVRIGSVPGLRAVVGDLQGHHSPGQVARVLEAASPLRGAEGVVARGRRRGRELLVVHAAGDAGHAGDDEAAGGRGDVLPPGRAVVRLHAGAHHLDVLVLGRRLGEPLELGDAAGRALHGAVAGGQRAPSGV